MEKKNVFFRALPEWWGGVYPCPNCLALFLEVHFWSIKRVYFFKNASEAVWQGASGRCRAYSFKGTTTNYLYFKGTQHTLTSSTSPSRGHTPTIFTTPSRGHTVHTHTNFFHFFAMGHAPNYLYVYNPTYSHLATVVVSLIISSFAQPQLHIHQSLFLESTNAHLPILSPILKGK